MKGGREREAERVTEMDRKKWKEEGRERKRAIEVWREREREQFGRESLVLHVRQWEIM